MARKGEEEVRKNEDKDEGKEDDTHKLEVGKEVDKHKEEDLEERN